MVPGDIFDYFGLDLGADLSRQSAGAAADELRAKGYRVWTSPQEKGAWISAGDTSTFMHALIQVTDNGTPALTSFQRVIVKVAFR